MITTRPGTVIARQKSPCLTIKRWWALISAVLLTANERYLKKGEENQSPGGIKTHDLWIIKSVFYSYVATTANDLGH